MKRARNVQAFTLIELLVVIAILGVLVLIFGSNYISKVKEAETVHIRNDLRAAQEVFLINEVTENAEWKNVSIDELVEVQEQEYVHDLKGLAQSIESGTYKEIPKSMINTSLKGGFYVSQGGDIYYSEKPLKARQRVVFQDASLEQAVREVISNPDDDIYSDELLSIVGLRAEGLGISSLEGLQYATNIQKLYLKDNNIADLNPLSSMKDLVSLELQNNKVSDLQALSESKELNYLNISENIVSSLDPLSGLDELTRLYVEDNKIQSVSPLKNNIKLERLNLASNQNIFDFEELSTLTNLTYLSLNFNNVSDISWMNEMVNMEILNVYQANIEDISVLSNLTNLESVGLATNEIKDIYPLLNLDKLKNVDIRYNPIDVSSNQNSSTHDKLINRLNDDYIFEDQES